MRQNRMRWALPGIVFASSFAMSAACGSEAPNISGNDCPVQEAPTTTVVTTTTGATSGAGGTTSASTAAVTAAVTATTGATSTGSGMQAPMYDVPEATEIVSRLHACHKLTYNQLGNFLRSRGAFVPDGSVSDLATTTVMINGVTKTLGMLFGGSNSGNGGNATGCEMANTDAQGAGQTNDPLCPANEICFCNQSDKVGNQNLTCLDVGNTAPDAPNGYCVTKLRTAAFLYFTGQDAVGVAKLDSRLAEREEHSTASAMKVFDIFVQAAPELIANIGDPAKAPACTMGGKNQPMFDSKDGSCVEDSVSCLLGQPATDDHMLLCNLIVQKANAADPTDLIKKRNLAVAVLLSAAHSCQ